MRARGGVYETLSPRGSWPLVRMGYPPVGAGVMTASRPQASLSAALEPVRMCYCRSGQDGPVQISSNCD